MNKAVPIHRIPQIRRRVSQGHKQLKYRAEKGKQLLLLGAFHETGSELDSLHGEEWIHSLLHTYCVPTQR